jgi:hypothetical protein
MHVIRAAALATVAATAAFAVGAPAVSAQVVGPCGTFSIIDIGESAGTGNQVCTGVPGGIVNIEPQFGQVATVTGPIVTGASVGSVIVSAGAVVIG